VNVLGEVYKPEDFVGGNKKPSDLSPGLNRFTSTTLQDVLQEIRQLKTEITKIKQALKANGIIVE